MSKTIAFDFDGVLHSYVSGWTGPVPTDPPVPGAVEAIHKYLDEGYSVVILTTRAETDEGLEGTKNWLRENGFPPLTVTFHKVPAIAYIDDRAVHFDPFNHDWEKVHADVAKIDSRPRRTPNELTKGWAWD